MSKISSYDFLFTFIYIIQALFFLVFFNTALSNTSYSYLFYIIISIFLSISVILIFIELFKNNKTIFQMIKNKVIITILLFITIIFTSYLINNISNLINYIYLNNTNKIYINITLVLAIFYLLKNNILTFFKVSTLIIYFYIILEIITFILLIMNIDFNNLLPITTNLDLSIDNVYLYIVYLTTPILYLLVIPKKMIKDNKRINSKIMKMFLIVSLIILIKSIVVIGVLGYHTSLIYNYPDIYLYKLINISLFERMEWLLAFNSITNIFLLSSLCCFYLKEGISYLIKKTNYKISLIISFIVLVLSMINISNIVIIYLLGLFFIIHLIYCLFSLVK